MQKSVRGVAGHLSDSLALFIFRRHVVLRHFVRVNLPLIRVQRIFDALDGGGLEGLALFKEFLHALGIQPLVPRNSLVVAGQTSAPEFGSGPFHGQPAYAVRIKRTGGGA